MAPHGTEMRFPGGRRADQDEAGRMPVGPPVNPGDGGRICRADDQIVTVLRLAHVEGERVLELRGHVSR